MLFQHINFRRISLDELYRLFNNGMIHIDKPAYKELQEILEYGMTKPSYKDALNSLFLILLSNNDEYISKVKSSGVLRYSRYINQKCIIASVLSELLNYEKDHSYLRNEDKEYLTSLYLLKGASCALNDADKNISNFITRNIKIIGYANLAKNVLSYVDYIFMPNPDEIATEILEVFFPKTKEDIAEAASYLLYKISSAKQLSKIKRHRTLYNCYDFIYENNLTLVLQYASIIIQIKEWEIYIESFGYHFKEEENGLLIEPPYIMLEKSIRLGYIRTELQYDNCLIRAQSEVGNSAISIVEYASLLQKSLGDQFTFEYKEDFGFERFVMQMPEYVVDVFKKQIIDCAIPFKEDLMYLSLLGREQLITNDNLHVPLIDTLSIKEFLNIRNVFIIINVLMCENLKNKANGNLNLFYNSLIPMFSKETLIGLITKITTKEKALTFLEAMSWAPESQKMLDLQYSPFICIDDYYAMPLNILANSNVIRNLHTSMHKSNKLVSDGHYDPLVQIIQNAFKHSHNPCRINIRYSKGDIDIIAKVDNTLIVLECKNTLHPTSVHDMRTTWNHVVKGQKQLRKIQDAIENHELDDKFKELFGSISSEFDSIIYAVVLSCRIFVGNYLSYPVRSVNDFVNLLHEGIIITSHGEYCQWEENQLTANDLYNYFYNNKELSILEKCLVPIRLEHSYIQPNILKDWYCLDKEKAVQLIQETYHSKINCW